VPNAGADGQSNRNLRFISNGVFIMEQIAPHIMADRSLGGCDWGFPWQHK
jgi:hypothetical protein